MAAQPSRSESQEAPGERFGAIENRSTVDYALRTVQQSLVQFSAMADSKASIVVTISALIFTISLTQLDRSPFRFSLVVLLLGTATALVLAVLCAMPFRYKPANGRRNLLFFLHVATLSVDRYLDEMDALLSDGEGLTDAIVRDIHAQSEAITRGKYRFLRWSYLVLIASFSLAALGMVVQLLRPSA